MYVYFNFAVHYTCYVNKFGQIKLIQIHPEPRPTPESLEGCGWVLKCFPTRVGLKYAQDIDTKVRGSTPHCHLYSAVCGPADKSVPIQMQTANCSRVADQGLDGPGTVSPDIPHLFKGKHANANWKLYESILFR